MRGLILIALFACGCIPSFEQVECYSALDCPSSSTCMGGVCVSDDAGAGEDAAVNDAAPDAGEPDEPDGGDDASTPDAMNDDGGREDAGPDGGMEDAGYVLQASPPIIDFGERAVQCAGPDEVATITNLGITPVTVTGLSLAGGSSPAFSIGALTTPFTLNPAASQDVTLSFLPGTSGLHNGRLLVAYSPEPVPETVDLTGVGVDEMSVSEQITQGSGAIDILFVIDDNTGMFQLQRELANQVLFMTSLLEFDRWDYQIGVTSADVTATGAQGLLLGTPAIIRSDNVPDPQVELEDRVILGETGHPDASGLEASRLALSDPLISGANAGFLRQDAGLLVIYLAKEPDVSAITVPSYVSFLEGLKSDPAAVHANAIVPESFACTLSDGTLATEGDRQIEMATSTGGVVDDACGTDFLAAMTTLPIVPLPRAFPLGSMPLDPNAIEVRVGGTLVPSGNGATWTYDAGQNAIVFAAGQEPQPREQVEITYSTGC